MSNDSYIITDINGKVLAYVGPDATALVKAKLLKVSLGVYQFGIIPTKGMTLTKALAIVTTYTGKRYKRSEWEKAQQDLEVWIKTMHVALPIEIQS